MNKKTIIGIILVVLFITVIGYGDKNKTEKKKRPNNTMENNIGELNETENKSIGLKDKFFVKEENKKNNVKDSKKEEPKEKQNGTNKNITHKKKDNNYQNVDKIKTRPNMDTTDNKAQNKINIPKQNDSVPTKSSNSTPTKPNTPSKPKDVITYKNVNEDETIAFQTITKNDPNLEEGKTKVIQNGANGTRRKIYKITYVNGKLTNRELISNKIINNPVDKIVAKGTKKKQESKPVPESIGNSGKIFKTHDEAWSYGNNIMMDSNSKWVKEGYAGFRVSNVYYSDGLYKNWTVDFYKGKQ